MTTAAVFLVVVDGDLERSQLSLKFLFFSYEITDSPGGSPFRSTPC